MNEQIGGKLSRELKEGTRSARHQKGEEKRGKHCWAAACYAMTRPHKLRPLSFV